MLDLKEEFNLTKQMTIEVDEATNKLNELLKDRLNYFKDITRLLNNYREELREIDGLEDFNYCDCPKDIYFGRFDVHFNSSRVVSAKGLSVIEEITGCRFVEMLGSPNDMIYVFQLENVERSVHIYGEKRL